MKKQKKSIFFSGAIIIILVIFVLSYNNFLKQQREVYQQMLPIAVHETNTPMQMPTAIPTPTESLLPIATDWNIKEPSQDILANQTMQEKYLILGIKENYTTQVIKKNVDDNSQTTLFSFTETTKAEPKSGNLWESLPANIALSPDKQTLAFTDKNGLNLFDLTNNTQKNIIHKLPQPTSSTAPQWSPTLATQTFELSLPGWSGDGRYLSFSQVAYEGSNYGLYDTKTNEYHQPLQMWDAAEQLVTSPNGVLFANPHGGYAGGGLTIGSVPGLTQVINIAASFDQAHTSFGETIFSPDSSKVLFLLSDIGGNSPFGGNPENRAIGIASVDGSGFSLLQQGFPLSTLFFSPDGKSVYYIQKGKNQSVLIQYNLLTRNIIQKIGLPENNTFWKTNGWTKDGYLTLQNADTFFVLDLTKKKIIYSLSSLTPATTIAGLTNK